MEGQNELGFFCYQKLFYVRICWISLASLWNSTIVITLLYYFSYLKTRNQENVQKNQMLLILLGGYVTPMRDQKFIEVLGSTGTCDLPDGWPGKRLKWRIFDKSNMQFFQNTLIAWRLDSFDLNNYHTRPPFCNKKLLFME